MTLKRVPKNEGTKKHHEGIAGGSNNKKNITSVSREDLQRKPKHEKITREAATGRVPGTSVPWGSAGVAGLYFALLSIKESVIYSPRLVVIICKLDFSSDLNAKLT